MLFVGHTLVEIQNLEKKVSIPNLTSQTSLQYKYTKSSQSSVVGQNNEQLVSKETDVPRRWGIETIKFDANKLKRFKR